MSPLRRTVLAVSVGILVLAGGVWLGGHPETLPGPVRDTFVADDRGLRAELIEDIKDNFYKPVKQSKLDDGSLKGIVGSLDDPFSNYLTPKETKQLRDSIGGEFEGVGMSVEQDKRGLRVLNVFGGSPAKKAGIQKGDFVTEVDGKSIAGLSSSAATAKIKGKAGSKVRLQIVDPKKGTPRELTLERKRIVVPVAEGRVIKRSGKTYGVVKLQGFSSGAHSLLRQQISKVRKRGAQGLVLDLRGNGGGLLNEGVLVASTFIENGLITYTKGRTSPRRNFNAEGDAIPRKIPVVVLVDRGSASASEIVTGALRDTGRATVVGTRTFGKGVFQQVLPLSNDGVLDITVGQYFLPKGSNIQGKGIKPQVKASDDPDTKRDEALPIALDTLSKKLSRR
ncbi:MAG: S41 family peptidase [Thermoleophilaceae bacterium]